jgi:hypothetical protein
VSYLSYGDEFFEKRITKDEAGHHTFLTYKKVN